MGCREVREPLSGGLLISMLWTALHSNTVREGRKGEGRGGLGESPYAGPGEALHIVEELRQLDVLGQHLVPHKVLDLVVNPLVGQSLDILQTEVLHLEDRSGIDHSVHDIQESLMTLVNELMVNKVGNDQEAILLIELPLFWAQFAMAR